MIASHCIHRGDIDMLTYMSVERVHWLRSKAQFERWMEAAMDLSADAFDSLSK